VSGPDLPRLLASAAAALVAAGGVGTASALASTGPRCVPAQLNASDVLPGTTLAVSPLPGSYDASPYTQVSFVGAPAAALSGIRVSGSQTGAHGGYLRAYSQGDGASYLLSHPFRQGETVTVRGAVAHTPFSYSFTVAQLDVLPHVISPHPIRDPNEKQHFRSRPDVEPPALIVSARSPQASPGYIFATPYNGPGHSGPMVFDEAGNLVWFDPLPLGTESTNLQVQQLEGKPVLTWWQGYIVPQGFGQGEEILADSAYRTIDRIHAGNGYRADLHDFHITSQTTGLMTVFQPIACDLAPYGGPAAAAVTDSMFQEIDLHTGLVRREWHSLDHVPLTDSYNPIRTATFAWPFDFFHINSVDEAAGGAILISARNTWAMYELNAVTGQVVTTIGGRHSNVKLAGGAATAFQHDAEARANGTISVFDNGGVPKVHTHSRGLIVSIDPTSRQVNVLAEYAHPGAPLLSGSQGNIQQLENGDEFIGWGSEPYFSEFSSSGQLLYDAHMHGSYESYRTYRFQWAGGPAEPPAVAAVNAPAGAITVFMSWNGDTRTASWRVFAGPSPHKLAAVSTVARSGFETATQIRAGAAYVAVQALDGGGSVLGDSAATKVP
jgi:hypothetical protein